MSFEDKPNTFEVYQEYLYSFEDFNHISVFFINSENKRKTTGALFHQIVLSEKNAYEMSGEGIHLCGKDEYKTEYLFVLNQNNHLEEFQAQPKIEGTLSSLEGSTQNTWWVALDSNQ